MAALDENESCRLCSEKLAKKSRRLIFNQFFSVFEQLCEIVGHVPHVKDGESPYVCSACFNKLNRLNKIEFDLKNKVSELRIQKLSLVGELRKKYLTTSAARSSSTPKKLSKRIIQHSPTPRKVKSRPEAEFVEAESKSEKKLHSPTHRKVQVRPEAECGEPEPKSKKKLNLTAEATSTKRKKEFTPGKVKVRKHSG